MALAAGMKTAKLKYGNRGHNQVNLSKKSHPMNIRLFLAVFIGRNTTMFYDIAKSWFCRSNIARSA